jgi:hypothetical protein
VSEGPTDSILCIGSASSIRVICVVLGWGCTVSVPQFPHP